jgi:predicted secreted protein
VKKNFVFIFIPLIIFSGCAGTVKLDIDANPSVGDSWECVSIMPEGIVSVSRNFKYYSPIPFPGMGGKYIFKFKAIAEGEVEVILSYFFRDYPKGSRIYKAVVDKRKKLTLGEVDYTEHVKSPFMPIPGEYKGE